MGCDLTKLSAKYESRGNAGAIGFDAGGGWSYGSAQIATKTGTMKEFLAYLENTHLDFYSALLGAGGFAGALAGTDAFKRKWKELAAAQARFGDAQHEFIVARTYNVALNALQNAKIDFSTRPCTLKNTLYSFSVMAGPGRAVAGGRGACGLIFDAVIALGGVAMFAAITDDQLLDKIYTCKLDRIDRKVEYASQPENIRKSVRNRVVNEHKDAVAMLAAEKKVLEV